MIRKLIKGLVQGTVEAGGKLTTKRGKKHGKTQAASPFGQRVEIPVSEHGIDLSLLDKHAIDVVTTLQQAGYEAYVVGGAVRDLLLGLRPKDFDVATDATPEQVKKLFRKAFIIGKRFRIVHVVFGGQSRGRSRGGKRQGKPVRKKSKQPNVVIEVSTFRAFLDHSQAQQVAGNERTSRRDLAGVDHAVDATGRVLRDNVWGPQCEDATRRDLTINAMYYDPSSEIVVDYHGGYQDMQAKRLHMIGDAATRYREDPVRIMRAVRFMAKLRQAGFTMEQGTAEPIDETLSLLAKVPQSRLFDESLKLFLTGHALDSVAVIRELDVAHGLYSIAQLVVERADEPLVQAALQDTDARVAQDKSVVPYFLLASVLWKDVQAGWKLRQEQGENVVPALSDAINEVFDNAIGDVSGRGRLAADMREVWMMQPRFERRRGKAPHKMVGNPRFRAALDFLRLRELEESEKLAGLYDWWSAFYYADEEQREAMLNETAAANPEQKPKKRRRRRKRKPNAASNQDGTAEGVLSGVQTDDVKIANGSKSAENSRD